MAAAERLGAPIGRHRSRKLTRELIDGADVVFCMSAAQAVSRLDALVQAQAIGTVGAGRWAARASVANRMELHVYQPSEGEARRWEGAEARITGT